MGGGGGVGRGGGAYLIRSAYSLFFFIFSVCASILSPPPPNPVLPSHIAFGVCPSDCFLLNHQARQKLTKLASKLPLMVGVCKSKIIFQCILASHVHASVCHAVSSNTTGCTFNQTCYTIFTHGKGVCERHYFSMYLSMAP